MTTCATCRHWTRGEGLESPEVTVRCRAGFGKCRGAPPTAVLVGDRLWAVFPLTSEKETCGAYSPRVPQPDPAPPEPCE